MEYVKELPSNAKNITDGETGISYSSRDITIVSSMVNPSSSLLKFGEGIYNKYDGADSLFLVYEYPKKGKGYIVYHIKNDCIFVKDIYSECISEKEDLNCYESLIETVFNICKSMNKKMVCKIENKKFDHFVKVKNQLYKEQKIEDKYWWKIQ